MLLLWCIGEACIAHGQGGLDHAVASLPLKTELLESLAPALSNDTAAHV